MVRTAIAIVLFVTLTVLMGTSASVGQIPGFPGPLSGSPDSETPPPEAGPGGADAGDPTPAVSPEEAAALVQLLADPGIQAWLRESAQAAAEDQASETAEAAHRASFSMYLQGRLDLLQENLAALIAGARALPAELDRARVIWSFEMPEDRTLRAVVFVGIFLAIGILAEAIYRWLTGDLRRRLTTAPAAEPTARLSRTALRFIVNALSVGVFALASIGAFLAFDWPPIVRLFIISLLGAFVIVRLIGALSVFLVAPVVPALRLVPIDNADASYLHGRVMMLAVLITFGALTGGALTSLGFLPQGRVVLAAAGGLLVAGVLILMVWERRELLVRSLTGGAAGLSTGDDDSGTRIRASAAALVPWLATLYILTILALWVIGSYGFMWILVLLVLAPAADQGGRWAISAWLAPPVPSTQAPEMDRSQCVEPNPFIPVLQRTYRGILAIVTLLIVITASGFEWWTWADTDSPLAVVLSAGFNIVVTLLLADFAWQMVRTGIDRKLREIAPDADPAGGIDTGGEGGGAASPHARLQTLLPIMRNFAFGVLVVMVTLIVLSSLGVDIGPLLAGAGVVGLAIGFGSQALVRDVISGAFMLAENTLSVGDVVKLGEHSGVVEALTIRSVRLRDLSGTVHTIPLGEITAVENMTRDFSYYVMDVGISYSDDVDLVIDTLHELGKQLQDDPTLGWDMLEPLEVLGVDQFADSAVIIKARIKTIPLRQWAVGREFNRLMKKRFDELGITIPFPQMTISYETGKAEAVTDPLGKQPEKASPEDAAASPETTAAESAKAG